jgi:hypothetical protein
VVECVPRAFQTPLDYQFDGPAKVELAVIRANAALTATPSDLQPYYDAATQLNVTNLFYVDADLSVIC